MMLRFLCYGLVSALAVAALAFTAASASQTPPPPPLQERIPATEAADTATLVQIFDAMMRREYAAGVRPAPRGAHPKAHGCVHATFTVRKGLAPAFRYGAFSVARSYPAWIRFSNGSPKQRADD
ncbi:MAG TPA: hypothetical protein VNG31_02540, partial [Candidatus Baltobacteraceae bacterium]|nr:hypothetical protein [Candidatus Baltobacteraceae bacterium]